MAKKKLPSIVGGQPNGHCYANACQHYFGRYDEKGEFQLLTEADVALAKNSGMLDQKPMTSHEKATANRKAGIKSKSKKKQSGSPKSKSGLPESNEPVMMIRYIKKHTIGRKHFAIGDESTVKVPYGQNLIDKGKAENINLSN